MTWALKADEDSVGSKGRGAIARTVRTQMCLYYLPGGVQEEMGGLLGIRTEILGQEQLEGFSLNARLVCHGRPQMSQRKL